MAFILMYIVICLLCGVVVWVALYLFLACALSIQFSALGHIVLALVSLVLGIVGFISWLAGGSMDENGLVGMAPPNE